MKTPDDFEQDLKTESMYQLGNELVREAMNRGIKSKDRYDDDIRGIFNRGIRWLEKAAENNCVEALDKLAGLYATGDIDDGNLPDWDKGDEYQNLEQTVRLYEQAYALNPQLAYLPERINDIEEQMNQLAEER